jgi:hypothetical protein
MDKMLRDMMLRVPKDALVTDDEKSVWQAVRDSDAFDKQAATFAATDNSKVLKAWMDVQASLEKLSAKVIIVEGVPTLELAKPANYVTVGATVTRTRATGGTGHKWSMSTNSDGTLVSLSHDGEAWVTDEPAATYLQAIKQACIAHDVPFWTSQFKRLYERALAAAK